MKKLRSLTIRGASSANRAKLAAATHLRLNERFTKASVRSATKALLETGLVDNVRVGGEKTGHLTFNVRELPVIQSISITGNVSLKRDILQKEVKTELEKPLSPAKLREDIARIIGLYEGQGLERPLVSGVSEISEGNRADLVIVITEHGAPLAEPVQRRRASRRSNRNLARLTADARPVSERQSGLSGKLIDPGPGEAVEEAGAAAEQAPGQQSRPSPRQAHVEAKGDIAVQSAGWSGRPTVQDHVRLVRAITPRVMSEIDTLVQLVEARRFNDPETEAALDLLRSLHRDLGELIEAVDTKRHKPLIIRIGRKNTKLVRIIKAGAKVGAVAPALTIGISHLLSALTGVPVDSTMVSTVFATMIAMPIVEQQIENSARAQERPAAP